MRSNDAGVAPVVINRESCLPGSDLEVFFKRPLASLDVARSSPLKIDHAYIGAVPESDNGWLVALGLYAFMGFYALGPGVCVWLALSELMPTRIRSNGMSIALVANHATSTLLAGTFLPVASKYGYSTIFFMFASCSIIYLLVVTFYLPETKGKTLEQIDDYFETREV